jgi:hypothetical protein
MQGKKTVTLSEEACFSFPLIEQGKGEIGFELETLVNGILPVGLPGCLGGHRRGGGYEVR